MNDSITPTPHQLLDDRFAAAADRYRRETPDACIDCIDNAIDDAHEDPAHHLDLPTGTPIDAMLALSDDDFYARFHPSMNFTICNIPD